MRTILFSSERDKNGFAAITVHKDEMENNDPLSERSTLLTSMKTKVKAS